MHADQHVQNVLINHASPSSIQVAQAVIASLTPSLMAWANGHLVEVIPAGSIAKGTAIKDCSDVDILVSVPITAKETSQEVYEKLFNRLDADGFAPHKQNVSIGMTLSGWKVDVVPAKRQSNLHTVHNIWSNKKKGRRETNIHHNVSHVSSSGRIEEIRLVKIWKKLHKLEFPSFPLEIAVIKALEDHPFGTVADNFVRVLEYLRDEFPRVRLVDPTKPSNILSDELSGEEKSKLSITAGDHLNRNWAEVLWET